MLVAQNLNPSRSAEFVLEGEAFEILDCQCVSFGAGPKRLRRTVASAFPSQLDNEFTVPIQTVSMGDVPTYSDPKEEKL